MTNKPDWPLIRRLATTRLGVDIANYYQWYCRGNVPHKYRLPLVAMSAGAITAADFDEMDKAARKPVISGTL